MEKITGAANKRLKLAASLMKRKYREEFGLFRAEGVRLAEMALASSFSVEFAIVTTEALANERCQRLISELNAKKIPCCEVAASLYRRISDTASPQGVMLIVKKTDRTLAQAKPKDDCLYVVLGGLQDPGNVGTIIRTAEAAGADGIISLPGTVDIFSDKTVRSSMGAVFYLPVYEAVSEEILLHFCREIKATLYAADVDTTANSLYNTKFAPASVIAFGNEGNGLSSGLLNDSQKIYIPMFGKAESLNVASSAAVLLYECRRQRQH